MKRSTIVLILAASLSQIQAQPLTLSYPGYAVSVAGDLQGHPDAGFFPLVSGKLDTLTRQQQSSRFGLLYRGAQQEPGQESAFTFIDASTGSALAEFSVNAYTGGSAPGISQLPERSVRTDSSIVDAFRIDATGGSFIAIRTITLKTDASLPLGRSLSLVWDVEFPAAAQVRVVLNGVVEGEASAQGNALTISPAADVPSFGPRIILTGEPGTVANVVEGQSDDPTRATLTGPVVTVQPGTRTSVFSTRVIGTTVAIDVHVASQATQLIQYLNGAPAAPVMITRTLADKPTAAPGDTVTYRIVFHNTGTAPATDVALTNPLNEGLTYITGTATGDDADISIDRTNPEPPQSPVVEGITWTFLSNILPGEERWVSFKAIVQ